MLNEMINYNGLAIYYYAHFDLSIEIFRIQLPKYKLRELRYNRIYRWIIVDFNAI